MTSAQTELFIGLLILGACLLSFYLHPGTGFQFMLGLAMVMKSMDYLAAPALALLAERDLRKSQEAERYVSEPVHGSRSPYHTMKRSMNSPDSDRSAGRPY